MVRTTGTGRKTRENYDAEELAERRGEIRELVEAFNGYRSQFMAEEASEEIRRAAAQAMSGMVSDLWNAYQDLGAAIKRLREWARTPEMDREVDEVKNERCVVMRAYEQARTHATDKTIVAEPSPTTPPKHGKIVCDVAASTKQLRKDDPATWGKVFK